MTTSDFAINTTKDWARRPASLAFWWVLPIVVGASASVLGLSLAAAAFTWAGAFAWMGTGCLLNAWRCTRLHCFVSGPVLWLGAIAAALVGSGAISGVHALNNVVSITAVLAMLSCIPEMIWGRYTRRG
ncbi:MAG TPA: hypothetical protein VGI20_03130 [Rhizomicrobium sp.]